VRLEDLTDLQLDTLRELGSIGSGHAATALSQLMGKRVALRNPELKLIPLGDIPGVFGGPEQLVGAVYVRLLGDIEGGMLFLAPRASLLALFDLLHARNPGTTKSFGHEQERLITHVASVLAASYIAAIARMADLNVLPSTPSFVLDMAGAILEVATTQAGIKALSAMLIRTAFYQETTDVDVALFFMPEQDSLEILLGRLGMV